MKTTIVLDNILTSIAVDKDQDVINQDVNTNETEPTCLKSLQRISTKNLL